MLAAHNSYGILNNPVNHITHLMMLKHIASLNRPGFNSFARTNPVLASSPTMMNQNHIMHFMNNMHRGIGIRR